MTWKIVDFSDPSLYVDRVHEVTRPLYDPSVRYIMLKGWSGSWKSHIIVQLLLQNVLDWIRIWAFRKYATTIKASCYQLVSDYNKKRWLSSFIEDKVSTKEFDTWKWLLKMFWLDDEEKIKSLADYDWFWVEETNEITYDDFTQLDLRLRWWKNHKIICTFNPVSSQSWLKTKILDSWEYNNAVWIEKTAWQNKFVDEWYLRMLDGLKTKNPSKWKIYANNQRWEWLQWSIFPEYSTFDHDIYPDIIWMDFWFNDPTTISYLKFEDKDTKRKLYIQEKMYKTWLTGIQIVQELDNIWVPRDVLIIADNARPEIIQQISDKWYTIKECSKWKWSIQDWISKMLEFDIYINWSNAIKEFSQYVWKIDRHWNSLDIPVDWMDHIIDWSRYAVMEKRWNPRWIDIDWYSKKIF